MTDSFVQAQQRVAARRQAREAQNAALLAAQRASSPRAANTFQGSRLLYPVTQLAQGLAAMYRSGTFFRVGQIDAEYLDNELLVLLQDQVGEGLKYFSGGHLKDDWSDEVSLAMRAVLFKLTVWDNEATYGAALQNLKFVDARKNGPVLSPPSMLQKSAHGLVNVFGSYGWAKWEQWLVDNDGYAHQSSLYMRLAKLTNAMNKTHSVAALASFVLFLLNGRYRTILDRILRMRLAPPASQLNREVNFEFLNRQLVWHAFTEFLLFMLPLIGINKWRRWLNRTWRKTKEIMHAGAPEDDVKAEGEYAFLPERTCAICYQDQNIATTENEVMAAAASGGVIGSTETDITAPFEAMPCGCVYCFTCISARIEREEGEGWTCLRCGDLVKGCKAWTGDVLQPTTRSNTAKTVAFTESVAGGTEGDDESKEEGWTSNEEDGEE